MQAAAAASQTRMTNDGLVVSASAIQRLEKKRKYSKDVYDSLKINQLTNHGKEEDPARRKKEDQQLMELRKEIKKYDGQILEIRLALMDSVWKKILTQSLHEEWLGLATCPSVTLHHTSQTSPIP